MLIDCDPILQINHTCDAALCVNPMQVYVGSLITMDCVKKSIDLHTYVVVCVQSTQ